MFVTMSHHAQPILAAFAPPGTQTWKALYLSCQHPWFLSTFLVGSGDDTVLETWGIVTIHDLVGRLEQFPDQRLTDLLCLMPAWRSPTSRWSGRQVASIWRATPPGMAQYSFVLKDVDGNEFVAGLDDGVPDGFTQRELIAIVGTT